MRLSELQSKDIINTIDGKKIGTIIDVIIKENGQMTSLVVEKGKFLRKFSNEEIEINWSKVKKIGEDVILVSLDNL